MSFFVREDSERIPNSCCSQCRKTKGLCGRHTTRCLILNQGKGKAARRRSRSKSERERSPRRRAEPTPPPPVSMQCLQSVSHRIGVGHGNYLTWTDFSEAKIILVSGGIGRSAGDRPQERQNFENILWAGTCLERSCLRRRDIQGIIHRTDDADRRTASSRNDAVYNSIRQHPKFQSVIDAEVAWIQANVFCGSLEKVLLGISCRSGKHRSIAVIRSIADTMPGSWRVVQLDTAAMTKAYIDIAMEWMGRLAL